MSKMSVMFFFLAAFVFVAPEKILAQRGPAEITLANTQIHEFRSSINHSNYQLQIILPPGYNRADTVAYPTLYLLDGNLYAPLAATLQQLLVGDELIRPMLIVGIGYPVKQFGETYAFRSRDFTPTAVKTMDSLLSHHFQQRVTTGSAESFFQVIEKEIIPFIEKNFKVNQSRTLFGHSFGGLFAAHVLFQKQSVFQGFLLSSPTIDWDQNVVFKTEQTFAKANNNLPARVFLSVGLDDEKSLVVVSQQLASLLKQRNYHHFLWRYEEFPGEGHMSVVSKALATGLRTLFKKE